MKTTKIKTVNKSNCENHNNEDEDDRQKINGCFPTI